MLCSPIAFWGQVSSRDILVLTHTELLSHFAPHLGRGVLGITCCFHNVVSHMNSARVNLHLNRPLFFFVALRSTDGGFSEVTLAETAD